MPKNGSYCTKKSNFCINLCIVLGIFLCYYIRIRYKTESAKMLKKQKNINMTEGSVFKSFIMFTLPLMATNLLQVLYTATDTIVVSLSKEPDAVGAIGTTTALINLLINIFIGCSVGAKVTAAVGLGAKDEKAVENTVRTAITLSTVLGIVCCIAGICISHPALAAMGNTGRLLVLADRYTKIHFLGVPFISLTNFCIALIHAAGDTETPLHVLLFTGFLHVILNLFFVLVCGMSVEGMALASTISNAVSAVLLLVYLVRSEGPCRLNIKRLGIEKRAFLGILHIGLPAGIQSSLFSLSHMVIQSSIVAVNNAAVPEGSAFQPVVKGSAAGTSIESFGYTAVNSTAQAAISFTGQNVGTGNFKRVVSVRRACYIAVSVFSVIFAAVMLSFRGSLLALYGVTSGAPGSLDRIAYDTAVTRMLYMFIPYFLLGFMEVGSGVMQGLGCSVTSSTITLLGSVAFRILWIATAFRAFPRLEIVFLSYPISWFLTAAAQYVRSQVILKKRMSAAAANVTAAAPSSAELQP